MAPLFNSITSALGGIASTFTNFLHFFSPDSNEGQTPSTSTDSPHSFNSYVDSDSDEPQATSKSSTASFPYYPSQEYLSSSRPISRPESTSTTTISSLYNPVQKYQTPDARTMSHPDGSISPTPSPSSTSPTVQSASPMPDIDSTRDARPTSNPDISTSDHASPSSNTIMCALLIFGGIALCSTIGWCLLRKYCNRRRQRTIFSGEDDDDAEQGRIMAHRLEMSETRSSFGETSSLPAYGPGMGMQASRPPSYVETEGGFDFHMVPASGSTSEGQRAVAPGILMSSRNSVFGRQLSGQFPRESSALTPSPSSSSSFSASESHCEPDTEVARKEAQRQEAEATSTAPGRSIMVDSSTQSSRSAGGEGLSSRRSIEGCPESARGRRLGRSVPNGVRVSPVMMRRVRVMTIDGNTDRRRERVRMSSRNAEARALDPPPAYEEAIWDDYESGEGSRRGQ